MNYATHKEKMLAKDPDYFRNIGRKGAEARKANNGYEAQKELHNWHEFGRLGGLASQKKRRERGLPPFIGLK